MTAIGFDASFAVGRYRGMGRYARALVRTCPAPVTWFAKSGQSDADHPLRTAGPTFHPLWEQWVLPRLARAQGVAWLVCPYNTAPLAMPSGTKRLVVVHDLIFLEPRSSIPWSASSYQNLGRVYRRLVVPRAVRRADAVITVSEHSRRQIVERFAIDASRICVIGNTVSDDWYLPADTDWDHNRRTRAASVLYVGGESAHKNLDRALLAFARLAACRPADEPWRFDVVGVPPSAHARVRDLAARAGVGERINLHGYVDTPALHALYRCACVLLFPSLAEGFGIPLLEAMASGCPAVVADRGSLPEVGGSSVIVVDPLDVEAMGQALASLVGDAQRHAAMARLGHARAMTYHPRRVEAAMVQFWMRLLSGEDA